MVGGLAILWLPLGRRCLELSGGDVCFRAWSGVDAPSGRRLYEQDARGASGGCAQLLQAFRKGKGSISRGWSFAGICLWTRCAVGPLPPELEGMKELQGRAVRVISRLHHDRQLGGAWSDQARIATRAAGGEGACDVQRDQRLNRWWISHGPCSLQPVTLSGAQFLRESYFVQGRFLRDVFAETHGVRPCIRDFTDHVFQGPVTFQQSRFNGLAEFLEVVFEKDVNLSRTYFKLGTGFSGSRFQGLADFSEASFDREAFFTFTLFDGDADFRRATFRSTADFSDASFKGRDDFSKALFEKVPQFTRVAGSATGQAPLGLENKTGQYATIILSLLVFGATADRLL